MENLINRLKNEDLSFNELEEIARSYEDDYQVLILVAKQKECSTEIRELCYERVFGSSITAVYSVNSDKLVFIKNENGKDLEFTEMLTFEFQEGLKEEAKALASMEIQDSLEVKGFRTEGPSFFIETVEESPEVFPKEAFSFRKKLKGNYLMNKAVLASVLFAVVGGTSLSANAQGLDLDNKVTIEYNLDSSLKDKVAGLKTSVEDNIANLNLYVDIDKERQSLEVVSKITKTQMKSVYDLKDFDFKTFAKTLDVSTRLDLESAVTDLQEAYDKMRSIKRINTDDVLKLKRDLSELKEMGEIESVSKEEKQARKFFELIETDLETPATILRHTYTKIKGTDPFW